MKDRYDQAVNTEYYKKITFFKINEETMNYFEITLSQGWVFYINQENVLSHVFKFYRRHKNISICKLFKRNYFYKINIHQILGGIFALFGLSVFALLTYLFYCGLSNFPTITINFKNKFELIFNINFIKKQQLKTRSVHFY